MVIEHTKVDSGFGVWAYPGLSGIEYSIVVCAVGSRALRGFGLAIACMGFWLLLPLDVQLRA